MDILLIRSIGDVVSGFVLGAIFSMAIVRHYGPFRSKVDAGTSL